VDRNRSVLIIFVHIEKWSEEFCPSFLFRQLRKTSMILSSDKNYAVSAVT